jgi:hypothetical protein
MLVRLRIVWFWWIGDGLIVDLLFSLINGGGIGGRVIIVDSLKEPRCMEQVGWDVGVGVVGVIDCMSLS